MRPCCNHANASATRCTRAPSGKYRVLPDPVANRHAVAGHAIKRGGEIALHREKGAENVANRLTEALRAILHPRIQRAEAAIPRRRAPHAPMIEKPHGEHRNEHERGDRDKKTTAE